MKLCPSGENQKTQLRVLFFEDDADDIALSLWALDAARFDVISDVAVTLEQFRDQVRSNAYDVILSDYRMPGVTGLDCLEVLKGESINTPFILVTGALGDEKAVECLKEGVADYVLKDRLARLPVAIRRALEEQGWKKEQAETQEALRRSEASYRSLIQSAPCGILRVDARSGRLLEVNWALVEMLGYGSPADLLSDSAGGRIGLAPELLKRLAEASRQDAPLVSSDVEWKHKDGTVLTIGLRGRLLRDASGAPDCFEMLAENLTSRRLAEQRVSQLNRLYSLLSKAGQTIVHIRERSELFRKICRVVVEEGHFNMAWVGLAEAETNVVKPMASWGDDKGFLDGIRCTNSNEPAGCRLVGCALRENKHVICNHLMADPDTAPCSKRAARSNFDSVAAFPLVLGGVPIGVIAIYASSPGFFDDESVSLLDELSANVSFALERIDADEKRRKLEDQLRSQNLALEEQNRRIEAANRMKSEFLANMSHELRSPLNGIIGFTELLYDGKLGRISEKPREFLNRIHKSAQHLLQLINGVLDLSKVEAGRIELRAERICLAGIAQEVTGILSALAAEKEIQVETCIDPEIDNVVLDAGLFKQVLHNYVSNALKFTGEGGRVEIRVKPEGSSEFRLEVADSGIGISAQDQPRLFTEFLQLDSGAGKRYQGTGLGLAFTKRIVEAQGGRVGVESSPANGSTFFAVLPRIAASTAGQAFSSLKRVHENEGVT